MHQNNQSQEEKKPLLESVHSNYSMPQSDQVLLIKPDITTVNDDFSNRKILKEILVSTSLFGIRGLVVAIHYAGNGMIMASLGTTEAAASSISSTLQGATIALSSGFLGATGVDLAVTLGGTKGPEHDKKIAAIIKTSWTMVLAFGVLAISILNSATGTLPLFLDHDVAMAANEYLRYFSIAVIPDLLIWNNGQIIFQVEKNSHMPLITNVSYRLPALILAYYFGKVLNLGPMGVGLGSAVSGWANVLGRVLNLV